MNEAQEKHGKQIVRLARKQYSEITRKVAEALAAALALKHLCTASIRLVRLVTCEIIKDYNLTKKNREQSTIFDHISTSRIPSR